jgi:hypothetical protein
LVGKGTGLMVENLDIFHFSVKAIPVIAHGGPYGCQTSRLPYFLDYQLTDDSEVVRLAHWLPFTAGKIPGTHFY